MALPSHGHVLPVHCLQSLSWRLSPRRQLHLEGQTLAPEPAGCSPATLHCQPGNHHPCHELNRVSAASPTMLGRYLQGR